MLQGQAWCDTVKQERACKQSQSRKSKNLTIVFGVAVAPKGRSIPMNKLFGFAALLCICSSLSVERMARFSGWGQT